MPTAAIETKGLGKTYGKGESAFAALNDVSIQIKKGESVAIVGKSGSGKSTLMHVLALLDAPTAGSVSVGGTDATELKPKELDLLRNRSFGFVFQQFFLNPNQTALENIILPLKIAGVPAAERERRGLEALKAVELEGKARSRANDLSGGQKQRVVIARALINEPEMIFADEPTGNLDSATGDTITDTLFALQKERGITLVIVTHDPDLAARCGRRIEIRDGRLA